MPEEAAGDSRQTSRVGRVIRNAALVGGAQFTSQALIAITAIFVVRYLGRTVYNDYATAMAYMGGFAIFARLGFNQVFMRECSKDPTDTARYYAAALFLNVILTVLAFAVALVIAYSRYREDLFVLVLLLGSSTMLLSSTQTPRIVFQIHQQLYITALITVVVSVLYAGALFTAMAMGASVKVLAFLHLAMNLMRVSLLFVASLKLAVPHFDRRILHTLIMTGLRFCVIDLTATAYGAVHGFTLAFFDMGDEVSYFQVPYRLFAMFQLVAHTVDIAAAPALYAAAHTPERMMRGVRLVIRYFSVGGFLIAAIMMARPEWIITVLFTADYAGAASVCRLMGAVVALRFIVIVLTHVLYAAKRERYMMHLTVAVAIGSVALCLLFVPRWGAVAAGTLLVAGEAAYCIATLVKSNDVMPGADLWKLLILPLGAAGLTMLFLVLTPSWPISSLLISPLVFLGLLWITRYYRVSEFVSIIQTLRRRR